MSIASEPPTVTIISLLIVVIGNLLDLINRLMTNKMGENVIYNLRNKLYEYIEKANIIELLLRNIKDVMTGDNIM